MESILIVEDDITLSVMLKNWLTKKGFEVSTVSSTASAKKKIEGDGVPSLILSDLRLPDEDGMQLLKWIHQKNIQSPLIIMTSYADIQGAVQAMKEGARDYIAKPMQPDELLLKIREILKKEPVLAPPAPAAKPAKTKAAASPSAPPGAFLEGNSQPLRQLYYYVDLVAPTNMSVLIHGASGTGKEYIANRIHTRSPRVNHPFVAIDCGAIPKELAASEFFGHVKGAFTGALADKTGAFVSANGGTLFLDEVGNLDYETQQRLLRALQERKIRPIGSDREISVDVRLISATNEDLEAAINKGNFREDLYHRINEFTLHMPSLNQCPEDIPLFADFFLAQANHELNKQLKGFTPDAMAKLQQDSWPGNLRQMKNLIKRATLLAKGALITLADLGDEPRESVAESAVLPLRDENTERQNILHALQQAGNNKSLAARMLGIDRKTLYNKLKSYGIRDQTSTP